MRRPTDRRHIVALALCAGLLCGVSCTRSGGDGRSEAGRSEGTPLARVGKEWLMLEDVQREMPGGISPEDSSRFVSGYVYSWLDTRLLTAMAQDELDMTEIDRLTEEYRNSLIAEAYRRKVAEGGATDTFSEDSIRSWYESHKSDFRLREPLVKGVYVKLPEKTDNLAAIRKLMRSDKEEDIDRLEKEVIRSQAIHYDYFRERWVEWDQIEVRVPYAFGSAESFLRPGRFLETTNGGYTYLLRVTEVAPKGSLMPYEAARDEVRERLMAERRKQIDAKFRADLLERALSTKRAEIYIADDPI
ncbi:MAG: peptidyl-prolyl cis-trans isomerase [Muribaculaceae bacterium]|nr:peptidyl-prolyl cis-trans isomerase [Muribaculaceae bacterium]